MSYRRVSYSEWYYRGLRRRARRFYAQLVHDYRGRWVVAERGAGGVYYVPTRTRKHEEAVGTLDEVFDAAYSYGRRSDALRRARQLFGYWEAKGNE